jgi:hypothetical protein
MIDYADNTPMIVDQLTPRELQRACEAIMRLIALAGKRGDCALTGMAIEKLRLLQRRAIKSWQNKKTTQDSQLR